MTEYVLEILDGDRVGEVVELHGDSLTFGRRPSNDVILKDEKVSGAHATVTLEDGQWVLRDLDSTNGTRMDGRSVKEVGLTANDIFQLGRIHVAFKEKGAPTPKIGGDLAVKTLDSAQLARTKKRAGGGIGLLVVLVLLLGGGGGYWFFLGGGQKGGGGTGRVRPVRAVPGNMLALGSDMETEGGWQLEVSGTGFSRETGRRNAHTGTAYLVAYGDESGSTHHAVARTVQDQVVSAGAGLRASARVRTRGDAKAALRLRFWSSSAPIQLTTGTAPRAQSDYGELVCETGVPPGCDRVAIELVALLPTKQSEVVADDVVLVGKPELAAHDIQTGAGQRVVGTGGALVIQDVSSVVMTGLAPITSDPGLVELDQAGLLVLSDAGHKLRVADDKGGVTLQIEGGAGLRLDFDAGLAAGGVLARNGETPFVAHGNTFELDTSDSLLLGYGTARFLVRLPAPGKMLGRAEGGRFSLSLPGCAALRLVYDFKAQRDKARELLNVAIGSFERGDYRGVSAKVEEALRLYPHDDDQQRKLSALRTKVRNLQTDRVLHLEAELDKAVYFESLSGYRRLRDQIALLEAAFGTDHLMQKDKVAAMRSKVENKIKRIEGARGAAVREKLGVLVKVYGEAGNRELAQMIKGYIDTLPEGSAKEDK